MCDDESDDVVALAGRFDLMTAEQQAYVHQLMAVDMSMKEAVRLALD